MRKVRSPEEKKREGPSSSSLSSAAPAAVEDDSLFSLLGLYYPSSMLPAATNFYHFTLPAFLFAGGSCGGGNSRAVTIYRFSSAAT